MRKKHQIQMAPLNKFYLEEEITNLNKIATTRDAHVTYKQSGWKASYNKLKHAQIAERKQREKELREKCEGELPRELKMEVTMARLGPEAEEM